MLSKFLASIAFALALVTVVAAAPNPNATTLEVTAIVGKNGISQLECWSLEPGFVVSTQPGTVGSKQIQLGLVANGSYTQFPLPGPIDAGLHNAPNAQWVVALTGNGTVTFPNKTSEILHISAGDILIAFDTPGTSIGHRTVWKGGSTVLQIPFEPDFVPPHSVKEGGCGCV